MRVALAAALGVSPAAAQQTLTLQNGDRLTGRLVEITPSVWKFAYLGETHEIALQQVATFESPDPVGIRLADGSIFAASVSVVDGMATMSLVDGQVRQVAVASLAAIGAADNLIALEPLEIGLFTPFGKFWSGTGSLGFSDKSGNSRARGGVLTIEVERRSPRDRLLFTFGLTREEALDDLGNFETTVAKYSGRLRAEVFAGADVFTFVQTRLGRDRFQDLSLRATNNGGLGFRALSTERTDLRISGSGGVRYESYVSGGTATVGVGGLGTDLKHDLGIAVLDWKVEFTESFQDLNDYQIRSEAALTVDVFQGLGLRLGLQNEFDNVPQPGIRNHDMLVTTTVSYSIGR